MSFVTSVSVKDEFSEDFKYLQSLGNKSQIICLLVHLYCQAHKKTVEGNLTPSTVQAPLNTLQPEIKNTLLNDYAKSVASEKLLDLEFFESSLEESLNF